MQNVKDITCLCFYFSIKKCSILGKVISTACLQYILNMANEGYVSMLSK